ncbi:MAG: hypothetical protein NXI31_21790 [bacterium]|nr:hypothetical protein [bacterium]
MPRPPVPVSFRVLAPLVLAIAVPAQIPLPPQFFTITSSIDTGGFYFQAPVNFHILGLEAKNELNQPYQVVEVIDFGTTPPPTLPVTRVGTQLFYANQELSDRIIDTSIPCVAGNWYGVLGACTSARTSATSYNAKAQFDTFPSDILGHPVTLTALSTVSAPFSGIASNGGNQPCGRPGGFGNVGRIDVYVAPGNGVLARARRFGYSCNAHYSSFYQLFNGPIDLQNSSLEFTPRPLGHTIRQRPLQWHTPTSSPIPFNDDQVIQVALGWTFPYENRDTTELWISSNGFVNLRGTYASGNSASVFAFLREGRKLAALWNDLDPSAGGAIYFDTDPVAGTAFVTFDQVPRKGTTELNTFQIAFEQNGNVALRYQNCAARTGTTLIGWTPGSGNPDPGQVDLSSGASVLTSSWEIEPMVLSTSARPFLGTTIDLVLDSLERTLFAGFVFGLTKFDPGIDLTPFGMPRCVQSCSEDAAVLRIGAQRSTSYSLTIPNDPTFVGVELCVQGAAHCPVLGPNVNRPTTSNALELRVGIY